MLTGNPRLAGGRTLDVVACVDSERERKSVQDYANQSLNLLEIGCLTGRGQRVHAIGGELLRADVSAHETIRSCLANHLVEDVAQAALSICYLGASMNERADVGGGVLCPVEADRRVGIHDCHESGTHWGGAAAQLLEGL